MSLQDQVGIEKLIVWADADRKHRSFVIRRWKSGRWSVRLEPGREKEAVTARGESVLDAAFMVLK